LHGFQVIKSHRIGEDLGRQNLAKQGYD
jgi:hypothetical protein